MTSDKRNQATNASVASVLSLSNRITDLVRMAPVVYPEQGIPGLCGQPLEVPPDVILELLLEVGRDGLEVALAQGFADVDPQSFKQSQTVLLI